ncbi:MAG: hypothetical protein KME21_05810 [Desmonostoc vinosum HA7617-LM4]|nr:hypothetical protein [Desmonostoc vinosum HA7617-LM4]
MWGLGTGDWGLGLGTGDWGLGLGTGDWGLGTRTRGRGDMEKITSLSPSFLPLPLLQVGF